VAGISTLEGTNPRQRSMVSGVVDPSLDHREALLVGLPLKPRSQHRQQSAKEADDPNRFWSEGNICGSVPKTASDSF